MSTGVLSLVIPGQVIASTSVHKAEGDDDDADGFLRGHGTYLERVGDQDRLIASVCGVVQRVNKLITVVPFASSIYQGQVGDLVVGRVSSVGQSQWKVSLLGNNARDAQLPLSGVHLPGGAQRMRTTQDERDMRSFLNDGDLISAEVHKVQQSSGALMLHTRSHRYSKLENGTVVAVPPSLIARRKNHFLTILDGTIDVLWGTNGMIWIQRSLDVLKKQQRTEGGPETTANEDTSKELAELQEALRKKHTNTEVSVEERRSIARFANAIKCLKQVHCMVSPESAELVYNASIDRSIPVSAMLQPSNVLLLTDPCRKSG